MDEIKLPAPPEPSVSLGLLIGAQALSRSSCRKRADPAS
jgi:hypothetical protein